MEVVTRPRVSNYSVYNAGDYSIYMFYFTETQPLELFL